MITAFLALIKKYWPAAVIVALFAWARWRDAVANHESVPVVMLRFAIGITIYVVICETARRILERKKSCLSG